MYKKIIEGKKPAAIYIKFALLLSLAYFPMWSFIMSLKNDALTLSYPPFRFFSEQLAAGHIPWWHFDLHMGFPLHSDPGFPFWSPITWLWAIPGASLYTYTFLIYSYILIAGIGVLKLAKWFRFGETSRLFVALAFCISGFFSAHLQHPHYIFEAAFVPFALLCFLKLAYSPDWKHAILLAISIFFLVNSGYPSFTISAIYFFTILLACMLLFDKNIETRRVLTYLPIAIIISILLCLPFLYSIYQFVPFYNRSTSTIENYIHSGGMSFRSFLSILFPLASVTDPQFFQTDRSWSNIYVGILATIFLLYGFKYIKHPLKWPLVISGLFMLIASTQGLLKELFYKILPLFDLMHSNGGLRIYYILAALVLAGFGMECFLKSADHSRLKRIALMIVAIFFAAIIMSFIFLPSSSNGSGIREFLKNLSVKNAILIQSVTGIVTILALILTIKYKRAIIAIGIAEMILAFVLTLPFTGLGLNSTFEMQRRIDSQRTDYSTYPSGLTSYLSFRNSGGAEKHNLTLPVSGVSQWSNYKITGDGVSFDAVSSNTNDTIVIAQNYYPNWKLFVNDKEITPLVAFGTFIAIPVTKGSFKIKGEYQPAGAIICFTISIFAWLIVGTVIYKKSSGRKNVYRNN